MHVVREVFHFCTETLVRGVCKFPRGGSTWWVNPLQILAMDVIKAAVALIAVSNTSTQLCEYRVNVN